ncbi:MAG: hypothetical protein H8E17_05285 [Deltaproteobacteria bacterium]|nr:hypothetical protein [Deltaproteobacteria bacterium]
MTEENQDKENKLWTKSFFDKATDVKDKTRKKISEKKDQLTDSKVGKITNGMKTKLIDAKEKSSKKISDIGSSVADSKAGQWSKDAKERMSGEMKVIAEVYSESSSKSAFDYLKDKTIDKFDTITGAKILEEVRKRLSLQDRYNDILASRLAEALERISSLEKEFK